MIKSMHFLVLLVCFISGSLWAQELSIKQRILMPGEVIEGHAEFEAECKKCHSSFDKEDLPTLCLDCHEEIQADRDSKKGFHGQGPLSSSKPCNTCHTDHLGRDADIIQMQIDAFDHDWTRFPLKGAHGPVACESCHNPEDKYRVAESSCSSCHKQDDVHNGSLGNECESCHKVSSWQKRSTFDHSSTDYPLDGAHKKAECNSCHAGQIYEFESTECVSCHKAADAHAGKNGKQCDTCHSVEAWDKRIFDHSLTEFPLRFKHNDIPCRACHQDGVVADQTSSSCSGCHKNDDKHLGRNGDRCESCHKTEDWGLVAFDHRAEVGFPLLGQHKDLSCTQCHAGALSADIPRDCGSCHAADDVHKTKEMSVCATCHVPQDWKIINQFDHQFTEFPLVGLHQLAPCQSCHVGNQFAGTKSECVSCHKADDHHKGGLGDECQSCHSPNDWNIWQFDHNKQTQYALEGSHKGLACDSCHLPGSDPKNTPSVCAQCHERQDIHSGGFGKDCSRCHSQDKFFDLILQGLER